MFLLQQATGTSWDMRTLISQNPWLSFALVIVAGFVGSGVAFLLRRQELKRRAERGPRTRV
jgi:hypothetical protein